MFFPFINYISYFNNSKKMNSFDDNSPKTISGGIDISRLINKDYLLSLGDFYKCSICSKIMINPTDCEYCGHSFCYECISKEKCPFNCVKKNLKPASNGITNLLNNLKFKCINEGCDEEINYIDIKTHENICPFQKMICPNQQCGLQVLKKDLENHIKDECNYTMITCENCGYKFPRCQISEHEKMCNLAYQSFSSRGSITNNSENKDQNKENNNNFIQTLDSNIKKILKEKNNNINNEQEKNNEKELIKKSDINPEKIKENNINNNIKGNIFNDNDNNDNQNEINESINNNNELSRLSLRQSTAQIEEDDLIDILKKAIEEKFT